MRRDVSDWRKRIINHCGYEANIRAVPLDAAPLTGFGDWNVVAVLPVLLPYIDPEWADDRLEVQEYILRLDDGRWAWLRGGMELEAMDDDRQPEWWPFGGCHVALDIDLLLAFRPSVGRFPSEKVVEEIRKWAKERGDAADRTTV